jgi:transcriptional regulator with XRE-family HTH domain
MAFGDRLRRLREAAGLSQDALAHKAGLTTKTVYNLERRAGWGQRTWRTVVCLADALGVSLDEFREPTTKRRARGKP